MVGYDPSADPDDTLPPGPKGETFSHRLRRLARFIHGVTDDDVAGPPTAADLARRSRMEEPFEARLDAIFRGALDKNTEREPGQEG